MCGNTLNRTRAGGAIEIPKGPEKREKATLVYILKVSKFQKRFFLFSFEPKTERFYIISALRI